jgi:PAS domain S-box-containing protein
MSPFSIVLRVAVIIFSVEAVIMLAISALPVDFQTQLADNALVLAAADGLAIVLLSTPVVYFWVIRPYVLARTAAESTLRANEQRLIEAQRLSHLGSWELDLRTNSLNWSEEIYRIFEIDPEQFGASYEAFLDAIHPDDREMVDQAYTGSLANRTPYAISHRLLMGDGRIKWVQERCETEFDDDGKPLISMGTVQDITERRRVETELRNSEETFRQMAENISEIFWMTDPDKHKMIYVSPVYEEVWQRSSESLYENPLSFLEAIHPDDRDRVAAAFEKQAVGDYDEEYRVVRPDGTIRLIRDRAFPVTNDEGRVYRVVGIAVDITEHRRRDEQLHQAQKMEAVGHLTGGVAHDFNNLLTAILGNLEFVAEHVNGDAELLEFTDNAIKATLRGADLTQRLLAFSRKQALQPEVTDVNNLATGMTKLMRRTLGEHIGIENIASGGLWPAVVDRGQLENVLLNLAINARDAMPDGGKLIFETANVSLDQDYADRNDEVTPGDYVMLAITDNGAGIAPEVLDHVFEPFFTTKEVGKGSGLGLSMVYGFAKQSGGHIKIYSEVGQGTTVRLYLPRAVSSEEEAAQTGEAAGSTPPRGDETILVVEDDPDVRSYVVTVLKVFGYNILEAEDGPAALTMLAGRPRLDLLLTDVVLPKDMNGRRVAEEVRKLYPEVRVLFTSGYTENAIVHNGTLDEDAELLAKPYTRETLARRVRTVLDEESDGSLQQ